MILRRSCWKSFEPRADPDHANACEGNGIAKRVVVEEDASVRDCIFSVTAARPNKPSRRAFGSLRSLWLTAYMGSPAVREAHRYVARRERIPESRFPKKIRRPGSSEPGLRLSPKGITFLLTARPAPAATGPPPPPPAIVVIRRSGSARTGASRRLTHRNCCSLRAVEVRLVLLVDFLALFVVEFLSALDEDGALIGLRLPLVKLAARLGRNCRCGSLGGSFQFHFFHFGRAPREPAWPFVP